MEKGRYKYFPVIQNPEKAKFNRSFVYVNKREWTDPSGKYQAAICLPKKPNSNGMYVVDTDKKNEYCKDMLAVLNRAVAGGVFPIIGPFDSVEEAVIAERKVRPLTDQELVAQAKADQQELATLRIEKAEKGNRKPLA